MQRRLSNGIKVNYWYSGNEPQSVMIRVCAAGGRALEGSAPGPSGSGSVIVGTRSLSESGRLHRVSAAADINLSVRLKKLQAKRSICVGMQL